MTEGKWGKYDGKNLPVLIKFIFPAQTEALHPNLNDGAVARDFSSTVEFVLLRTANF